MCKFFNREACCLQSDFGTVVAQGDNYVIIYPDLVQAAQRMWGEWCVIQTDDSSVSGSDTPKICRMTQYHSLRVDYACSPSLR